MSYVFEHEGKVFSPDGCVDVGTLAPLMPIEHNKRVDEEFVSWLKTGPDRVVLYVSVPQGAYKDRQSADHATYAASCGDGIGMFQTWLGTKVSTHDWIGKRNYTGFGGSYRRPVSCKVFGVSYYGWYMESSGDYCRLKKSKRQG